MKTFINILLFFGVLGLVLAQENSADRTYMIEGLTVTGSKSKIERSNIETPAPVDIIESSELVNSGFINAGEILNQLVPSFVSMPQTFSDGADHINPATLRGLGPDQVLVLINGKRRHNSSLAIVTPVVGRGSVGTDLNAIPVSAIQKIEVLRDGAAAQYGSDAIAGVINIVLKEQTDGLSSNVFSGTTTEGDGETFQVGTNFGFEVGESGFVNITGEARRREAINRANEYEGLIFLQNDDNVITPDEIQQDNQLIADRGLTRDDFNLIIGPAAQTNAGVVLNSVIPVNESGEFYAFGGLNYRDSRSAGFYRFPNDSRNNTEIYPNGFLPFLVGTITDRSFAFGLRGEKNGWNYDLSNTYGGNSYQFNVENSLNRSLGNSSPTEFYAGTLEFSQNTTNFDINRNFGEQLGLNSFVVALGAEFRVDNFKQIAGEESSYALVEEGFDPGSQVFPGFRPSNEVDATRTNAGFYAEITSDITDDFMVSSAGRFESYSDFGNNFSWKLSSIYKIADFLNVRATYQTGFRAPSLQQQYYSSTSTFFIPDGAGGLFPVDVLTANQNSRIVQAFGVGELQEELSQNISFGITGSLGTSFFYTADFYRITIDDRIVLTNRFDRFSTPEPFEGLAGVDAVQFFTNAINTETIGFDLVLGYNKVFEENHNIALTFAFNYNETEVGDDIKTSSFLEQDPNLESTVFNREERARIESGMPNMMGNFTIDWNIDRYHFMLRSRYFGEVTHLIGSPEDNLDQTFEPKFLNDFSAGIDIIDGIQLIVGANNIFDVYPDENIENKQDLGRFPYNTAVTQFGFMGRYIYSSLNIKI